MPDIPDLLGAWREATGQLQRAAAAVADRAGQGTHDILSPLERQSEVIEQLVRRQLQMEQDLVHGVMGPALAMTQALGKAPEAIRAQATAFRAAAASFSQAADLLDVQADAVEQTIVALQTPVQLAKRGLGRTPDADG